MTRLVDLSMPLFEGTIACPGHPNVSLEPLHLLERDGLRNTILRLSLHTATHIDAPWHFIEDGETIDRISLERFYRPAVKLDLTATDPGDPITFEVLRAAGFDPGEVRDRILVLATGWTDQAWQRKELYGGNPYLSTEAAKAIAAALPSALALDFGVDPGRPWPNHTILLGAGIPLIEYLVGLPSLPAGGFKVIAFPLRIAGENGSPARVVAEIPDP